MFLEVFYIGSFVGRVDWVGRTTVGSIATCHPSKDSRLRRTILRIRDFTRTEGNKMVWIQNFHN